MGEILVPADKYWGAQTQRSLENFKIGTKKMHENLHKSLMLATALSPHIGYENAARVVHLAHKENLSLKEACLSLGFVDGDRFDEIFHPEEMI